MRTNSSFLKRLEQLGNAIRLSGNCLIVIETNDLDEDDEEIRRSNVRFRSPNRTCPT